MSTGANLDVGVGMAEEQGDKAAETPEERVSRYLRKWLRSPKAPAILSQLARELKVQQASYVPDSPLMRSFLGMVSAWASSAHHPQKGRPRGDSQPR